MFHISNPFSVAKVVRRNLRVSVKPLESKENRGKLKYLRVYVLIITATRGLKPQAAHDCI